tara:strand:- start:9135 stop:9299 length:165 start_codon:yes stop_codon:yes gene_type:complete
MSEELWNTICWKCKWKGVSQDLHTNDETDNWWVCPKCGSEEIETVAWHKGNEKI